MNLTQFLILYAAYLALMSLITLVLFFRDKSMAKRNGGPARIPEKILLGAVSLGGAVGGFFGRILARHKTEKIYFSITIYASLVFQLGVLALILYLRAQG
ncbi:MAG: DUF1294 domain-containing protein [Clostridia bacterium]|nr:DUF1294 domain-containing protein [Clostridia bacterium]